MIDRPARPLGVTILAILAAIAGFLSLLGGVAALGISGQIGATAAQPGLASVIVVLSILILLLGLLYLAFAYGAWRLRPWAWSLGVVAAVVEIVLQVLDLLGGRDVVTVAVNVLVGVAILWYLNTPAVRAAFGRPATGWR
jgi:uncharacterized membrane protein (DUF2068 family)